MFPNIRADLAHYSRYCYRGKPVWRILPRLFLAHPAAAGVLWFRFGSLAWRMPVPVFRQVLQLAYLVGLPLVRVYSGVQIQPDTVIGPGLAILHFGGVVIAPGTQIGSNCLLHHNVNIVMMRDSHGAHIGDNFYAGVGTTIIEAVTIEDNVTAGAGCIITKCVPKDAIVAGVPARILRFRQPKEAPSENRTLRGRSALWLSVPEAALPVADGAGASDEAGGVAAPGRSGR
jgi:serine O-acetyltransferase